MSACTAIDTLGEAPIVVSQLAALYYHFGRAAEGDAILKALTQRAANSHVSAGAFVIIHAARGDVDEAIRWLHIGRSRRDGFFCQLKAWVNIVPIDVDPRIIAELGRVGFR